MLLVSVRVLLVLSALLLQWACVPLASVAEVSVPVLVQEANQLANQEKYPLAIQKYEQLIRLKPTEITFKNNLSVLYFNYGVQLQKDKKYPEANAYFDKVRQLKPNDKEALRAKGASFFYQAMDLRDSAQPKQPDIQALLKKASDLDPTETTYKKAMAASYMEEAQGLVAQSQLKEAASKIEQARVLDPGSSASKHSLVNLYLAIARDEWEQKDLWLEKVQALDASPETLQKIEQLKQSKLPPPTQPSAVLGGEKTVQNGIALPAEAAKLSTFELLQRVEKDLGIQADAKAPMKPRLEAAEQQVYGGIQQGPINTRVKQLYSTILGGTGQSVSANTADLQPLLRGSLSQLSPEAMANQNYLDAVFKVTEGRVIRWGRFPVRVYIEEPKDNALFHPSYVAAVEAGMKRWEAISNNFVKFSRVKSQVAADIQVFWTPEQYQDRFADIEDVPDYYKKYAIPKASNLYRLVGIASMLTPGIFGLAPQAIGAAMQYQQLKKMQVLLDESKISLGLKALDGLSEEKATVLLENIAAHEFGHALGLKGHSQQEGDLMFPRLRDDLTELPSSRDVDTLQQLYSRPATIILNVR